MSRFWISLNRPLCRVAGCIVLLTLVLALPAAADPLLYNNGPINGTINAWNISSPYAVADSFNLSGSAELMNVQFGAWNSSGDHTTKVNWEIVSGTPFTPSATVLYSGTSAVASTFEFTNAYGEAVDSDTFMLSTGVFLGSGTYYLLLSNAVSAEGNDVYWDENDGPSTAYDTYGLLAGGMNGCTAAPGAYCSESFTIGGMPISTPEPGSLALALLGSCALFALAARRRSIASAVKSNAKS